MTNKILKTNLRHNGKLYKKGEKDPRVNPEKSGKTKKENKNKTKKENKNKTKKENK